MRGPYYFVIVGHDDNPLFELTHGSPTKVSDEKVGHVVVSLFKLDRLQVLKSIYRPRSP